MRCGNCGKNTDSLNPPFVLRPLTSLGYKDVDFCTKDCFKEYVKKKFKLVDK